MSATDLHRNRNPRRPAPPSKEQGVAAIEFAIVAIIFFLIVFGILEFARVMYMFNTLPEVTRRAAHAAANISFKDGTNLDLARKRAVLNESNGSLPFGMPITYQNVQIAYLYLPAKAIELAPVPSASMPDCPAQNRANCMKDPNAANCIRAVQVSICKTGTSGSTCESVPYQSIFPVVQLSLKLPKALTIVSSETLGYRAGDNTCS